MIELQRCRDSDSVSEVEGVLSAAGVAYKLVSTAPNFDLSATGSGSDAQVIVRVPRAQYDEARAAMEKHCTGIELPEDHYLQNASRTEIVEILGQAPEWSPFDVAHARIIAAQKGIDLKEVEMERLAQIAQSHLGKPASGRLIFFGWVFSLFGGLIGLMIAWSLCGAKNSTDEGVFFVYDDKSREAGKKMLVLALLVIAASLYLQLSWRLTE
ncbi:MAG: hypothetical protein GXP30_04710 [Verrucomicrobia bacterium]|nr:hypothetical protein [Verrucomicrobiota bacterium]